MQSFRADNSPITYYISGRDHREWVLFLHAAFVDHRMFDAQTAYFKDSYNVLAVDLIGHGQSTDTRRGDSINKMSLWIYNILKKEKIEKVHIVGVSLGAVLAQDFANRYPAAVSSLACFGGYDINHFDPGMQKENFASQMLMMLKALVSIKWFARANRKISAYTQQAQDQFYAMNIRFPKRSFQYLSSLGSMVNRQETAPRTYPLLIGCGKYDLPMELSAVEMWKKAEPQSRMVIFDDAGHCVNMDVPQKFNEVLQDFWEEHSILRRY